MADSFVHDGMQVQCTGSSEEEIRRTMAQECTSLSTEHNRACATNSFSAGALSRTSLGSLQHAPDPLAGFRCPTSKGKGRQGGEERKKVMGKEEEGREKVAGEWTPLTQIPGSAPGIVTVRLMPLVSQSFARAALL